MIRVTLIFVDGKTLLGFSEPYHFAAFNSAAAFGLAAGVVGAGTPAYQFLQKRRSLLPNNAADQTKNVQLKRMRVSTVQTVYTPDSPRNFSVYKLPVGDQNGTFGTAQLPVEVWTRLLVTYNLSAGATGRQFFGGVPEAQLTPPNIYTPAASTWGSRFDNYVKFLLGPTMQMNIQRRTQANDGTAPIVPIATFSLDATGRLATVTPSAIGPGVTQPATRGKVIIRGRHPSAWNGTHRYTLGTVNNTILVGPVRGFLGDFAVNGGTLQLYKYDYEAPGSYGIENFVRRDTGNPSPRPRGRRPLPR